MPSKKRKPTEIKNKIKGRTKNASQLQLFSGTTLFLVFVIFLFTGCMLDAGKENVHWGVSMENTKNGCS